MSLTVAPFYSAKTSGAKNSLNITEGEGASGAAVKVAGNTSLISSTAGAFADPLRV